MKLLLIVDLQNDFCENGALPVNGGSSVVPVANELLRSQYFDATIASRDWHPANHASFKNWPVHCVEHTSGAEFHPALETKLIDVVFLKGEDCNADSLSAFIDEKGRETKLASLIDGLAAARGETRSDVTISVVGLALDYCVGLSALDARKLGFKVELILDGTRAVCLQPGDDLAMLQRLINGGVELRLSREILEHGRAVELPQIKREMHVQPGI
jgi:nicotinamidase/pyrazinamidase